MHRVSSLSCVLTHPSRCPCCHRNAAWANQELPVADKYGQVEQLKLNNDIVAKKAELAALVSATATEAELLEEMQCKEEKLQGWLDMEKNERDWVEKRKEAAEKEREREEARAEAARAELSKVRGT